MDELARALARMRSASNESEWNTAVIESGRVFSGDARALEFLATLAALTAPASPRNAGGSGMNLSAQRFARVKIAEIQLYQAPAVKAGAAAFDAKRYSAAIATLEPLVKRLPKLADYAAWYAGLAQSESKNYAAVPKALEPVWKQTPPSPLAARAVLLAARAYGQNGQTAEALDILRKNYATLPQPQGDWAMASAFGGAGDSVSAAVYYQRVYYGFPSSPEAAEAETSLAKLR